MQFPSMESAEGVLNVAIVEDHALQRERTEEVLRTIDGVRVVCRVENLPVFLGWLQRAHLSELPHLLVLDLSVDRGPAADPSVVAGLVRDGEPVWFGSYGSPAVPGHDALDVQYRIGSITKTMTAVLVLQLVRDGRIALDDPASTVLGDVGYADRTLRQLLSHSTGTVALPV